MRVHKLIAVLFAVCAALALGTSAFTKGDAGKEAKKAPAAAKIFLDISFHKRIGERCSKQKECFFLLTEFGKCDILLPTNGLCQNNPPV